MTPTARINAKGQITIPKAIREQFGMKPGDSLEFLLEAGRVYLRPVKRRSLSDFRGVFAVKNPPPFSSWEEEREIAWREATRRLWDPDELAKLSATLNSSPDS